MENIPFSCYNIKIVKLNVFRIPKDKVKDLKDKMKHLGLTELDSDAQKGYTGTFFFSGEPTPTEIPWVGTYSEFFKDKPTNKIYYAIYIWENSKYCFAISYGKAHFYLRPFCDLDFGTVIAKIIANEKDVRQKSSKKFAGKKKKEIRSYTRNSKLDIESGESIDYLQAAIIDDHKLDFGKYGKFGSSIQVNPDIGKEKLPDFFNSLEVVLGLKERFSLPRTSIINNTILCQKYEAGLITEIMSTAPNTDFSSNSHELYGVDFIFSGQEKYKFSWRGCESGQMPEISIDSLKNFMIDNAIPNDDLLSIKVEVEKEDVAKSFSKSVRDSLDYIVDDEMVILSQGHWMNFNEDYINQLDEYVDGITIDTTEESLVEIKEMTEDAFNKQLAKDFSYNNADKDFSKIKVATGTLIEAWDLQKDDTVFAVKFGTTQKLGYVCDQSMNTLELINKKANTKKLPIKFKNYCLWLGFKNRSGKITKLSEINSIIFKQKIESWARKCWEYGIEPKIKISYIR